MIPGRDLLDDVENLATALRRSEKTLGLFDALPYNDELIVDHLSRLVMKQGIGPVLDKFYRDLPSEPESYKVIEKWRNISSLPRLDAVEVLLKGLYSGLYKGSSAIDPWLRSAARAERMVCAISDDKEHLGTGFLIGDDLVLTSLHVVKQADKAKVRLTFDSITFFGCAVNPGICIGLAADWDASDSTDLKALDLVVLRTGSSVGNQVIGASTEKRSWFALPTIGTLSVDPQDVVTLIHRPAAFSYFVSFGNYDRDSTSGQSFFHSTEPRSGSSGSPVVAAQNWDVLGVHVRQDVHERLPNFEAVMSIKVRSILEREKKLKLDPPPVLISQA